MSLNDGELTLADTLAATVRDLDGHIQRRAEEIAEPQILAARLDAKNRLDDMERETRIELQRKSDLVAELRRQLDAQVKANERLSREVKETREAVRRVELLHVWTNEDRRQFVFAEELWAALAEVSRYGPAALLAARPTDGRTP